jgi:LAO/AO transport system kinase
VKNRIEEEIKRKAVKGRLSCSTARKIAEEIGVTYKIIGNTADRLKIKITSCQLGCF